MNIWVFQTGEPLPLDSGQLRPMRSINLCNKLHLAGHRVTLWSADFDHQQKRFRARAGQTIRHADGFDIILLPSTGYRRNVGVARLLDHASLALNLHRRLSRLKQSPDVAFVGYPPIETAYVMCRWLDARGVPMLLDVKDQWPEIFINALPGLLRPMGKILLWPYFRLARNTMRRATALSAMAEGFLNWSQEFSGRCRKDWDRVFPLTAPAGKVGMDALCRAGEWWDGRDVKNGANERLYFAGSFTAAFDFEPVKHAAQLALRQGDNLQFVLCGGGGAAAEVKAMMAGLVNVIFPGWVDQAKLEALAARSIASIAPYRNSPDFRLSVPNKVVDSLSLGLPVLSPLKGEVETLIQEYGVGLTYEANPLDQEFSLYHAIRGLIEDKNLQNSMSVRARELYNARFLFDRVYDDLVVHLERLAALRDGLSA